MTSIRLWLHLHIERWRTAHIFKDWSRIEDSGWVNGKPQTYTYESRRCPCGATETRNVQKRIGK